MNCKWHQCNRTFEPTHYLQNYCSPECQIKRGIWARSRGGPLVDLAIGFQAAESVATMLKFVNKVNAIESEIQEARKANPCRTKP